MVFSKDDWLSLTKLDGFLFESIAPVLALAHANDLSTFCRLAFIQATPELLRRASHFVDFSLTPQTETNPLKFNFICGSELMLISANGAVHMVEALLELVVDLPKPPPCRGDEARRAILEQCLVLLIDAAEEVLYYPLVRKLLRFTAPLSKRAVASYRAAARRHGQLLQELEILLRPFELDES
jgi:hypothetical protein